jgi:sarcosine oxidase
MFDFAVIGSGLIGSAVTRFLSAASASVVAIGPDEPVDWRVHHGVFASHYDQGRITRILDPDPVWATLAARSIAAYPEIEAHSGLRFHFPVGCLRIHQQSAQPRERLAPVGELGRRMGVDFSVQDAAGLAALFPFLQVGGQVAATWERGGAGYINPRTLVQAQLTIARQQGATIVRETAVALQQAAEGMIIDTDAGQRHRAQQVIIAAGAWSNLLPQRPLELRPKKVTVVLAEVDQVEADRLASMPSILYRLDTHPSLSSVYLLPPIRYPDGNTYIKIGGALLEPLWAQTPTELAPWFHGDGNPFEADAVRAVLLELIPELRARSFTTRPCTYTMTAHGRPYVDQIDDGCFVATGGCGSAAKSSNEIGRLAARLALTGVWDDDLSAADFAHRCKD